MGARAKGARPFQYKDHTAWPPSPANFQWVHISNTSLLYVSTLHVPYIERSLVLNSSNISLKYHRSGPLCPPFPYYLTSRLSFTTIKCTLFAFVHNIPYISICMSCKLLKIFYYDRPKAIIDNICMLYKYTS